ncbi:hypothetical protein P7K49_013572 [Saguinus oedipus]|uniref:Acid-sensing ion channel 4 n=1 Tax=Saguinus oedipus TaxID=9490 RepID=A0ABQ9VGB0_SAGOE|nr:hypothetical protein P7K49_013572 [Saguinus oedipus]
MEPPPPAHLSFLSLLLISAPINQPPFPPGDKGFLPHEGTCSHMGPQSTSTDSCHPTLGAWIRPLLARTHAGADSCAGADKGSHKETIEERDKQQQRQQRQRQHQGCGAAGSGSDSPTSGPHPVPVLLPPALSLEEQPLPPPPLGRASGLLAREGRGREALASPSSRRQMPIEIVCKIKFAEEDAKPKEKEAGDEQSLLGAAQGAAAPRDLATFASSSTLHGLGRACGPGPHGLRRTLWALALLTSMAAFLYQAAGLAQGYLTRPHLVAMDPAAPAPVAGFPAVTLCNINRFRHSALSDADIFHLANLTGLPPKDRDGHRAAGLRYPEPDMVDILNRTGHQLADMLKSCNFSGHHCSASNFSVVSSASWAAWPRMAGGWGAGRRSGGSGVQGILGRASLPSATRGWPRVSPSLASPSGFPAMEQWPLIGTYPGVPAAPFLGLAAAAVPRAGGWGGILGVDPGVLKLAGLQGRDALSQGQTN